MLTEQSKPNEVEHQEDYAIGRSPESEPRYTTGNIDSSANVRVADVPGKLFYNLNAFGQQLADFIRFHEENSFISPFSISTALSMRFNALTVNSNSYNEMNAIYGGLTLDQVNSGFQGVLQSMHGMDIACSIWAKPDVPIKIDYTERIATVFKAEPQVLNSADRVNNWVNEKTHGNIPTILTEEQVADPMMKVILLNAIYFRGDWVQPFDHSYRGTFQGVSTPVNMMSNSKIFAGYSGSDTGDYEAVRLDYKGGEFYATVFLPRGKADLAEGLEMMKNMSFSQKEIELHMPSFKADSEFELKEALENVGMPSIFRDSHGMARMID
jgi:serine protease inhibitor